MIRPEPGGVSAGPDGPLAALVLAADRGPDDPVARAAGVPCKALAPVGGRPMVLRVLDALAASRTVGPVLLCGPPRAIVDASPALRERLDSGAAAWIPNSATPAASTAMGLATLGEAAALVTTADHALLRAPLVDYFAGQALATGADAVVGLVEYRTVQQAFPGSRRTVTRLRDGGYCGTNLFAFPQQNGRRLVDYWRRVEAQRKRPWRVIAGVLGPLAILRYATGTLTLQHALERLSRRLALRVDAVVLPYPEAAVDVDSADDLRRAEAILGREPLT